jgi:hypothetical protein
MTTYEYKRAKLTKIEQGDYKSLNFNDKLHGEGKALPVTGRDDR